MSTSKAIGLFVLISGIAEVISQYNCITPNGYYGVCTSVQSCSPITSFIQARREIGFTQEERQYFYYIRCYGMYGTGPFACCTQNDPFFSTPPAQRVTPRPTNLIRPASAAIGTGNILPNPDNWECGIDKLSNRIFGGTETEVGEFPWMALLEYQTNSGVKDFSCGGALINQRYVLTVAHCLVGEVIRVKGRLVNIRLGEHNTNTAEDCDTTGSTRTCSTPVVDVGIESTVVHSDYSPTSTNRHDDIGLVRLADEVTYTDYVQPICLPPATYKSNVGTRVTVAGWGKTIRSSESNTKQKVAIPVISKTDCETKFLELKTPITLVESQMCAGGELRRDTCAGDSGGPLMSLKNGVWYAEGLVSFGVSCGLQGWPGVYTKVTAYRDWITSNMLA